MFFCLSISCQIRVAFCHREMRTDVDARTKSHNSYIESQIYFLSKVNIAH